MQTNDGGPAFPGWRDRVLVDTANDKIIPELCGGMSLRDWFAATAMKAFMSSDVWVRGMDESAARDGAKFKECLAAHCYAMADVMLQQRAER